MNLSSQLLESAVREFSKLPGIGKKTAERLVLELKDKLSKQSLNETISPYLGNSLERDALEALIALGISRPQAESSIKKIILAEPAVSKLEDLIKKALKAIW